MALQGIRRTMTSMKRNDFKDLEIFLGEEKGVIAAQKDLMKRNREATKYFEIWGKLEGSDLEDIFNRTTQLLEKLHEAEEAFIGHYEAYRIKLKEVKAREKQIHVIKGRVKVAQDKHKDNIKKQRPSDASKQEVDMLEEEQARLEAEHEGSKRAEIREALRIRFLAYSQLAIKMSVIGQFGVSLADQIPQGVLHAGQSMPLYEGHFMTSQIVRDFEKAYVTATTIVIPQSVPIIAPPVPTSSPSPTTESFSNSTAPRHPREFSTQNSAASMKSESSKLERQDSRAEKQDLKYEKPDMKYEKPDLKYERQDSMDSTQGRMESTTQRLSTIYVTERPHVPTPVRPVSSLPAPPAIQQTSTPPPQYHDQNSTVTYQVVTTQQQQPAMLSQQPSYVETPNPTVITVSPQPQQTTYHIVPQQQVVMQQPQAQQQVIMQQPQQQEVRRAPPPIPAQTYVAQPQPAPMVSQQSVIYQPPQPQPQQQQQVIITTAPLPSNHQVYAPVQQQQSYSMIPDQTVIYQQPPPPPQQQQQQQHQQQQQQQPQQQVVYANDATVPMSMPMPMQNIQQPPPQPQQQPQPPAQPSYIYASASPTQSAPANWFTPQQQQPQQPVQQQQPPQNQGYYTQGQGMIWDGHQWVGS
ncbi:hypothetical protein HDV05_004825 [Chytridiales sp. JEL 0842]|nr:hypothetical protein HDV05_004825 [Chytridiales sp. JEL 0842]